MVKTDNFTILGPDLEVLYDLDEFESFIWVDRFQEAGDFEIYTPATIQMITRLQTDLYLASRQSNHIMVIESNHIQSDSENGNHLITTGRSLESILDRRIIWTQTVLTGNLQNGVTKLLDENAINPTDPDRKISRLIFVPSEDPKITELTLEAQFTGDNLYDAIQAICASVDIGFRILLNDEKNFEFSLYAGVDRSYEQLDNPYVVFSPKDENVITNDYIKNKRPYKTVSLVAGEGEGTARKTKVVTLEGGGGIDLERRESYRDARDISSNNGAIGTTAYNNLLNQRGLEDLAEQTIEKVFEGQMETTRVFIFGEDFFMGDVVQTSNDYEIESRSRVMEFIRSENESGIETYPTFKVLE